MEEQYDVTIKHTYYPLHPEIPEEGLGFAEFFNRMGMNGDMIKNRLKIQLEAAGLPAGDIDLLCNTRMAQELAKWAETEHPDSNLPKRLFTAYFGDGANISDVETLVAIAVDEEDTAETILSKAAEASHQKRLWLVFSMHNSTIAGERKRLCRELEASGYRNRTLSTTRARADLFTTRP